MSAIPEFNLIKNSKKIENLDSGNLSGDIYMAVLEYLSAILDVEEKEIDTQGYEAENAPSDTAIFDKNLAEEIIDFMESEDFAPEEVYAKIAEDWDLKAEDVEEGFKILKENLTRVKNGVSLLYEMY